MMSVLDKIRVPTIAWDRPRRRRVRVRVRGIKTMTPRPKCQFASRRRRGAAGGRRTVFDAATYRHRNAVERGINWIKRHRRPASSSINCACDKEKVRQIALT